MQSENSSADPLSAYRERLEARRCSLDIARATDSKYSNIRMAIFAGGVLAAASAFIGAGLSWMLVFPLAVAFAVVVLRHDYVVGERQRFERAVEFYERGIERLEDRWAGRGRSGQRFRDPEHPYSEDLDLFGRGSLFERLCTARTAAGEECIARWLLNPAAPEAVQSRQESVLELRERLDLREELDLMAVVTQKRVEPAFLSEWANANVEPVPPKARLAMVVFGLLTLVGFVLWALQIDVVFMLVMLVAGQILATLHRRRIQGATKGLGNAALELTFLEPVLAHLERDRYQSRELEALRVWIGSDAGKGAIAAIRQLQTLDGYWQMRGNILTGPVLQLFLITPHIASAVAAWRLQYGRFVGEWMKAVGEFEGLSALASYAYENPTDVFPAFVADGPYCRAVSLAHPLLPRRSAVANEITIDSDRRLYVISGSNMSGKSTLLRSIGTNVILAQAGAPVRAAELTMSPLQIGASIRTMDSLQEGVSRFYAEIRRLHAIVRLAEEGRSVLFLLDEILHGTNSHDRRIGADAVVRALLARGAVGLVTTHDLALAMIADDPQAKAVNVHFQDEMQDGKMSFDYHLKQGVVEKSNALELMRAVGLDV